MNDCYGVVCEAPRDRTIADRTIAAYAEEVAGCLKEANAILDTLYNNMFGPKPEKMEDIPRVPICSLQDQLAMNAEQSRVVVNRLAEMNSRMFG